MQTESQQLNQHFHSFTPARTKIRVWLTLPLSHAGFRNLKRPTWIKVDSLFRKDSFLVVKTNSGRRSGPAWNCWISETEKGENRWDSVDRMTAWNRSARLLLPFVNNTNTTLSPDGTAERKRKETKINNKNDVYAKALLYFPDFTVSLVTSAG